TRSRIFWFVESGIATDVTSIGRSGSVTRTAGSGVSEGFGWGVSSGFLSSADFSLAGRPGTSITGFGAGEGAGSALAIGADAFLAESAVSIIEMNSASPDTRSL